MTSLATPPLTRCTCGHFHDQSASCIAVARAKRDGERRAHLWTLAVFGARPVEPRIMEDCHG